MNVFQFSALTEMNWKANLGNLTNWQPKRTFYADFAIAEFCREYTNGKRAIENTYKEVISSWGNNYKDLTEIIMVLNHKIWAYYGEEKAGVDAEYLGITKEKGNEIAKLYDELYHKADDLFFKKFGKNKKATSYYFKITD